MIFHTSAYNIQMYEKLFLIIFLRLINKQLNFVIKFLVITLTYTAQEYDEGVLYVHNTYGVVTIHTYIHYKDDL